MNANEPKLTPEQSRALSQVIARTVELVVAASGWNRTCLTCAHFNEAAELCTLYQARPPARVIVEACPAWAGNPF
jgi:hypothetical protein